MIEALSSFLENLETWVLALASSVWIFPAVLAFAAIDGFFPPIPSESVIITLAVLAHSAGEPNLLLIVLVGALGAWTGDQIAFQIGRVVGTDRVRFLRTRRGRAMVAWAARALRYRGASFIFAARYIPIGRVAVNMTAGAVGYSRGRFMVFSAIAGTSWAVYSVSIGFLAAQWLGNRPLVAMLAGVAFGLVTGVLIDRVLMSRRGLKHAADDDAVVPGSPGGPEATATPGVEQHTPSLLDLAGEPATAADGAAEGAPSDITPGEGTPAEPVGAPGPEDPSTEEPGPTAVPGAGEVPGSPRATAGNYLAAAHAARQTGPRPGAPRPAGAATRAFVAGRSAPNGPHPW